MACILRLHLADAVPLGATTTLDTSSTKWKYCGTSTRRFIAVTKNATSFQDSRPPSDATPVTVLLETPTLLRCSVPPCRPRLCTSYHLDSCHVRSLYRSFTAVGGGTSSFTIQSSTVLISSHELLQQENVNILVANDGGHKDDYGSFWLGDRNGNGNHMGLSSVARGYPIYRAEGWPHVRTLFLTHYIRYYGIKTSDNLRVTSYCDSESLSRIFHTRDVDSSSWYLKSTTT
jgi:hypothetical protein